MFKASSPEKTAPAQTGAAIASLSNTEFEIDSFTKQPAQDFTREIGRISKNAREDIVVRAGSYRGHPIVDVRIFVDGGAQPTGKGVALNPRLADQLADLIRRAGGHG
jgi:Transcriptional Coactivator p15 (PC4)